MNIEKEINQVRFKNEYQKVHVNILFTASWLTKRSAEKLKPFKISWQQFNILRILRGLHPESASVKLLTERMIDKMSNASRLVEKLKQKGYVERWECPEDRRRVEVYITDSGLKILEKASAAMEGDFEAFRERLGEEEVKLLNEMLDRLRG